MGKLTPSKDEAENYNPNESLGRTSMQHAAPSRNLQHSASHKSMHSMSSSHDFSGPPRRQTVSTVTAPVPSVPKVFDGGAMPSLPTPKARKTSVEHPRAAPDSSLLLPAEHRKSSQSGHASERSGSSADEDKYSAPSSRLIQYTVVRSNVLSSSQRLAQSHHRAFNRSSNSSGCDSSAVCN